MKLHTNGRYNCGNFALVDEDIFMWNKCPKEASFSNSVPGVIRIMAPMDSRMLRGMPTILIIDEHTVHYDMQ